MVNFEVETNPTTIIVEGPEVVTLEIVSEGPQGPAGATGSAGATGAAGTTGFTGTPGADSTVPGPQGATGPVGPTGVDGATGIQGATGTIGVTGFTGAPGADSTVPGPQGATGVAGATGSSGTTGATGVTGTAGNTILYGTAAPTTEGVDGDSYIRTTTDFIYGPKAGGIWPAGRSLIGPTGATGTAGATGVDGATGTAGAVGATGVAGATGTAGTVGATGSAGATGAGLLSVLPYATNTYVLLSRDLGYGHGAIANGSVYTSGGMMRYYPFVVPAAMTVTALALWISTANTGGSAVWRAGLYNSDGTTGLPSTVIVDGGTASITTTGIKELSFTGVDLTAGARIWFCSGFQDINTGASNPAYSACSVTTSAVAETSPTAAAISMFGYYEKTGVTGALGSDPAPTIVRNVISMVPNIWMKVS